MGRQREVVAKGDINDDIGVVIDNLHALLHSRVKIGVHPSAAVDQSAAIKQTRLEDRWHRSRAEGSRRERLNAHVCLIHHKVVAIVCINGRNGESPCDLVLIVDDVRNRSESRIVIDETRLLKEQIEDAALLTPHVNLLSREIGPVA